MIFLLRIVLSVWLVLGCLLTVVQSTSAQPNHIPKPILSKLEQQTQAWNRADIKGFMAAYWPSARLRFIGKNGIKYGWENVWLDYQKSYKSAAEMGFLTFTLLDAEELSPQSHLVIGKWHLKRENDELEGYFTLVWKKIKGDWLIISDHSS